MRRTLCLLIIALLLIQTAFAQFPSVSNINKLNVTKNTAEKPQSKVWMHDGKHWTVLSDTNGAQVWKLNGNSWTSMLTISSKSNRRADCLVVGNVVHVLLFHDNDIDLISLEYVPSAGTYQPWQSRTFTTSIPGNPNAETATIDIDTNGRMWLAYDDNSNILVRWSDSPYNTWSAPISVASGIDADDIGAVIAFPTLNKIGVFWSNQVTQRWGFKMHTDGAAPNTWSADEVPASQSALNIGGGMADDHLNLKVSSNGTLYCAVKTSYDSPGYPRIALLIRRPNGSWDNLYNVSDSGTRGMAILNEQSGKIRIVYTEDESGGNIFYKESALSPISFGPQYTLISGSYNNPTSIKSNFSAEVVVLASTSKEVVGVLATDNSTPLPVPNVPILNQPANGATGVNIAPVLSWNSATNATYYQVQLAADANFSNIITDTSNISGNTLNLSGLAYITQYHWRVRAYNVTGYSNWSASRSFTTQSEPIIIPDTPTLNLPANNATNIILTPTLSWNAANNASWYKLQVSTASNFATLIADSNNITSLSGQLAGLSYSTQYFWRVKAYTSTGESNWSTVRNFTTLAAPVAAPAAPALVSPANNVSGIGLTPTLTWNAAANATTYQLQLATTADFLSPIADLNNLAALSAGISNLTTNTQYFWRVRAHNNIGASNWSAIWNFTTITQPTSLVGYWPMEDPAGTTLNDASGNGNNATTVGNPGFVTGSIGQALYLNGSTQYATVPSNSLLSPANAITLAAWIKAESSGSRQIILKKGDSQDGYELSITGSLKTLFRYNQETAGKNYQVTTSSTVNAAGQTWTHIAATFDGTTINLYMNGNLEKSETFTNPPAINSNNEAFSIGATESGSSRFQGAIDDARIYNVALTPAEISALATVPVARMSAGLQTRSTLEASPNPFRDASTLTFNAPENGEFWLILYNMAGKPVKILKEGYANRGEKLSAEIDGSEMLGGLYMVRLQTLKQSQSLKLMLEK